MVPWTSMSWKHIHFSQDGAYLPQPRWMNTLQPGIMDGTAIVWWSARRDLEHNIKQRKVDNQLGSNKSKSLASALGDPFTPGDHLFTQRLGIGARKHCRTWMTYYPLDSRLRTLLDNEKNAQIRSKGWCKFEDSHEKSWALRLRLHAKHRGSGQLSAIRRRSIAYTRYT